MFTHSRGSERGNRLESDLCLEKSQTSRSTLQLTHSVMTILIHSLMSKVLPPLPALTTAAVWSVAVCKEHRFGSNKVERAPHEGGVSSCSHV